MKTTQRLKTLLAATLLASSAISLKAADLYWGGWGVSPGLGTSWATAGNWFTDAGETSASGATPTLSDDLFFNTTADDALGGTIAVSANVAFLARSMTFNTTVGTAFEHGNNSRTLTLGAGGITLGSNSGNVSFNGTSNALWLQAASHQTWTNNSSSLLNVRRARAADAATGDVVMTLNAAGAGNISLNSAATDSLNGTKKLGLLIDSSGSGNVSISGATYSGGTTVKRGMLTSVGQFGTGTVNLGDTVGSNTATLRVNNANSTVIVENTLIVQSNSGTNVLEFVKDNTFGTWNGDIILNGDLDVGVRNITVGNGGGSYITGDISGSGDLYKTLYQGGASGILRLSGNNTYTGNTILENGVLTLTDTGVLTFAIGDNAVNNQITGNNAAGRTLNLDGDFSFDLTGASNTVGDSWLIVDYANLGTVNFGSTFTVQTFADVGGNQWTKVANSALYTFDESNGILSVSVIPEPSTLLLMGVALSAAFLRFRRKRTA